MFKKLKLFTNTFGDEILLRADNPSYALSQTKFLSKKVLQNNKSNVISSTQKFSKFCIPYRKFQFVVVSWQVNLIF